MGEIWLPVRNYEEYYEVSNLGNVRSKTRISKYNSRKFDGQSLKPIMGKDYLVVHLKISAHQKLQYIHRLVAQVHVPGYARGLVVNHKDGNKLNNSANNLEWVTPRQNAVHASMNNLLKFGIDNPYAVLNWDKVDYIRNNPDNLSLAAMARKLNVSEGCVRHVTKYRTWKGVVSAS